MAYIHHQLQVTLNHFHISSLIVLHIHQNGVESKPMAGVSINHCGQTHHVPNCQRGKTNPKQSCNVYFSVMLEEFRQRLNAQSDSHQGIAATKKKQGGGQIPLDLELGEINDVIGRKCFRSEALCLHKFSIRSDREVKFIHILQ